MKKDNIVEFKACKRCVFIGRVKVCNLCVNKSEFRPRKRK